MVCGHIHLYLCEVERQYEHRSNWHVWSCTIIYKREMTVRLLHANLCNIAYDNLVVLLCSHCHVT